MAKVRLMCDCGYEKEYDVQTYTDEFGVTQPDWSGLTKEDWICPECKRYLHWDGILY